MPPGFYNAGQVLLIDYDDYSTSTTRTSTTSCHAREAKINFLLHYSAQVKKLLLEL